MLLLRRRLKKLFQVFYNIFQSITVSELYLLNGKHTRNITTEGNSATFRQKTRKVFINTLFDIIDQLSCVSIVVLVRL